MPTVPSADEWNQQGISFAQQGRLGEAVGCFHPALAQAFNNLGIALQDLGQRPDAIAAYQQAIALRPTYANALINLASAFCETGQPDQGLACYRRAMECEAPSVRVLAKMADIFRAQGRQAQVREVSRQMVVLPATSEVDYANLGIAWHELGATANALRDLKRALELNPNMAVAQSNLGIVLQRAGRLEEAIACYREALRISPDFADAHNNLGSALRPLGLLDQAIQCFQEALRINPNCADAYLNLGHSAIDQVRVADAIGYYRQTTTLRPQAALPHASLGLALSLKGLVTEAISAYEIATALEPDNPEYLVDLVHLRQHACDWSGIEEQARRAIELTGSAVQRAASCLVRPFSFLVLPVPTTAEQQFCVARHFAEQHFKQLQQFRPAHAARVPRKTGRIRVGYLSVDLRQHPVGNSLVELFENHDRRKFEVWVYSYGPDDRSATRTRIERGADHFVDMRRWTHLQSAARIAADEIDILVDLTGYTSHSRTEIMALRPAPIQVSYWGYAGTMGASFMDYILVDDFIVPADQQPYFAEKLVHLPGCYMPQNTTREIAAPPSRRACNLPDEGFVFCSFNSCAKITPAIFTVWMNLLKAVPGSVLWLLEGKAPMKDNLRQEAAARGVAPDRLIFAPRAAFPAYLAQHRCADLFLDTPTYNAHTSGCDALYAGLPMVTVAGTTFAARVAGSLLRAVGLPELITYDFDAYFACALSLARAPERLAELRARLAESRKTAPFYDAHQFARHIESAFAAMLREQG